MARILTAVAPDTERRVRRILTGHDLHFVNKLAEAKAALDERINLIFVGARFDDSRMFDLLDHIRHDAKLKKIPIVAAIISPTTMTSETIAGLAHTTKIFGASIFVNLNDFPDDDTENTRLRVVIEAILLPAAVVPIVAAKLPATP